MTDFAGNLDTGISVNVDSPGTLTMEGSSRIRPPSTFTVKLFPTAVEPSGPRAELVKAVIAATSFVGAELQSPQFYWFERVHATPKSIELGNILTTVSREIEIYNAYREEDRTFTSATNNAGTGVSFVGLPSLPTTILSQDGAVFDVQISSIGQPSIDGTLDFVLDIVSLSIPITGERVVMFPFEPEQPIAEVLEGKTDIMTAVSGKEQRMSIREHPRQFFSMLFRIEDGNIRHRAISRLFSWVGVFGIPVWFESRNLNAAVLSGETVLQVDTTNADFRDAGLCIVWTSPTEFDALEITSHTDTTITLTTPVTRDYGAGSTLVMPLRLAYPEENRNVQRYLNNLDDIEMAFTVIDNGVDLSDISAWPTHNGKVMLDDANVTGNSKRVADQIVQPLVVFDNETGNRQQLSTVPVGRYVMQKGFDGDGAAKIWKVRQLFHALRGSQVSFYIPTHYNDISLMQNLTIGSDLMDIAHMDYVTYINAQEPLKSIRVELNDGTVYTREVLSASEIDSTTERLVVDSTWPATVLISDVYRISFLRLSRFDRDQISFIHSRPGQATIRSQVRSVLQ